VSGQDPVGRMRTLQPTGGAPAAGLLDMVVQEGIERAPSRVELPADQQLMPTGMSAG
jgi:hypothetical protein